MPTEMRRSGRREQDPNTWSPKLQRIIRYGPRVLDQPMTALWEPWRRLPPTRPFGSFHLRCMLDVYPRPHYAFGVQQAALLAGRLGLRDVSVLEVGVAGGAGLVHMQQLATLASEATGVLVHVHGFDRSIGLPPPLHFRDLPYHWQAGSFPMDVDALKARLSPDTNLVLGDLAVTVPEFVSQDHPPIGFVAIDVDFYSSTVAALGLFDGPDQSLLPRIWCYLDDIVGEEWVLHNDQVGELAAIREFNESHDSRMIAEVRGFAHKRARTAQWCDAMWAFHDFTHPLYNKYIGPPGGHLELPVA